MNKSPKECWPIIEKWIESNVPESEGILVEGADSESIALLEKRLMVIFPKELIESYMIHNGQTSFSIGLIDAEELLSIERIEDEWNVWNGLLKGGDFEGLESSPEAGIKNNWWNPKWIPLTYDGSGNHYCIDFDPGEGGIKGQIIRMWHDDPIRELVSPSFIVWFNRFVLSLEKGDYVFSDEYGGIILKEEIE